MGGPENNSNREIFKKDKKESIYKVNYSSKFTMAVLVKVDSKYFIVYCDSSSSMEYGVSSVRGSQRRSGVRSSWGGEAWLRLRYYQHSVSLCSTSTYKSPDWTGLHSNTKQPPKISLLSTETTFSCLTFVSSHYHPKPHFQHFPLVRFSLDVMTI